MGNDELIKAGRELLALETLAEIAIAKEEIERFQARFGHFETVEASYLAAGTEIAELDDAYLDWRAARERLALLENRLSSLRPGDAA